MYADLHMHSTFSDGTDTPSELLKLAEDMGIRVIAIADHDSIRGAQEGLGIVSSVVLIPAIEVSTIHNRKLMHMLGYYIDIYHSGLTGFIERISAEKTENTRINFENAKAAGVIRYDWERVIELHPDQPRISGVHVAGAMRQDGVAAKDMTLRELFHMFFMPHGQAFIETETLNAYDAVDIIKAAGGIPVIAHPKSIGDDEVVVSLIRYGVNGLEVYHPSHTQEEKRKYKELASEHRLYITGGSDWHGKNSSPDTPHMGCTGLETSEYAILNARA